MSEKIRPPEKAHPSGAVLTAFAVGNLSAAEFSSVELHVRQCDRCAAIVAASPRDDFMNRLLAAERTAPAETASRREGQPSDGSPDDTAATDHDTGRGRPVVDRAIAHRLTLTLLATTARRALKTPAVVLPLVTAIVCLVILLAT